MNRLTQRLDRRQRGFTLIELIASMVLVAMITAFGVPMFERLITNNRLTAQANSFLSALLYARTEAVKRGVRVTLCKSNDGTTCTTSGHWSQGWIAFTDTTSDAQVQTDQGETILRSGIALTDVFSFSGSGSVADYISYLPLGRTQMVDGVTMQSGTLTLGHNRLTALDREIVISRTGRAKVED